MHTTYLKHFFISMQYVSYHDKMCHSITEVPNLWLIILRMTWHIYTCSKRTQESNLHVVWEWFLIWNNQFAYDFFPLRHYMVYWFSGYSVVNRLLTGFILHKLFRFRIILQDSYGPLHNYHIQLFSDILIFQQR